MKLKTKLLVVFLIIGIIPFILARMLFANKVSNALKNKTLQNLESLRDTKKHELEQFFKDNKREIGFITSFTQTLMRKSFNTVKTIGEFKKKQIECFLSKLQKNTQVLSQYRDVKYFYKDLKKYFMRNKNKQFKNFDTYQILHAKHSSLYNNFIKTYNYNDFYIISGDGNILYALKNQSYIGKNIENLSEKEKLVKLYQKITKQKQYVIEDSVTDMSTGNYLFAGLPLQVKQGKVHAIIIVKTSLSPIKKIIDDRKGMGQTFESYILGQSNNLIQYRTARTHSHEKIGDREMSDFATEAFKQKNGVSIRDKGNDLEVVHFSSLNIEGLHWYIFTRADIKEIVNPKFHSKENNFYKDYIKRIDSEDVYLAHKNGQIFYSVKGDKKLYTNIQKSNYIITGLGKVFQKVVNKKQFVFQDFESFDNKPKAFIGSPIFHKKQLQFVIIVKCNSVIINQIMHKKTNANKTEQTYLIGRDKLVRSDPKIQKSNYSMENVFRNPETLKINTQTFQLAYSGKTGIGIFKNYEGISVLSAYTQIQCYNTKWILIAEMHEKEAFRDIKNLSLIINGIGVILCIIILITAFIFGHSITKPLYRHFNILKQTSKELQGITEQELKNITEQTTATTELDTTMEELVVCSKQISEASSNLLRTSEVGNSIASDGQSSLEQTDFSIKKIKNQVENIVNHMLMLGEKTQQMNLALEIINELSDQTTILSYNAAIEAAGAGEAGKRFSALAEQIMKLANKASSSTKNIKSLIDDIQKSTNKTVLSTEEGMKSVEASMTRVEETQDYFHEIMESAKQNLALAHEIKISISQQTISIEQTAETIRNIKNGLDDSLLGTNQTKNISECILAVGQNLASL